MTIKTMQTADVKDLLARVAGFDRDGGNPRVKEIVHRFMHDVFQLIEDFDVSRRSSGRLCTT